MARSLYTIISLIFVIRVQTVDISANYLRDTPLDKIIDSVSQEGELVG